jgi:hypothetical protein
MGNRKKTDLEVLIEALPILQKCGVSSVQVGEIAFKFGIAGKVQDSDRLTAEQDWDEKKRQLMEYARKERPGMKIEYPIPKSYRPDDPQQDLTAKQIRKINEAHAERAKKGVEIPEGAYTIPLHVEPQDLTSDTNPDTINSKDDTDTDDSIPDDGDDLDFYAT